MKKIFDIFIFILFILFIGCTPQQEENDSPFRTVICGIIQHPEVYPTTKEIFVEVIDFRDRKTVFKDSIQKDGTFKIIFDLYGIQDIKMRPLLDRLILHPGDSLFVLLDFSDISKVQLSGVRVESNQALRKYLWSNAGTINFYSSDKITPETYQQYCDSIRIAALKLRQEYIQNENPSDEIVQWTNDYITINYFKSLLSYPRNYFMRNKEGYTTWLKTNTTYFDFADSIENNFTDFGHTIINSDIYDLLDNYQSHFIRKLLDAEKKQGRFGLSEISNIISKNQSKSVFQQLVLGNFYYQMLCSNQVTFFDSVQGRLDSIIQVPFIRKPLFDFYSRIKKDIVNPEFASNAILSKMGVDGKNILDSIIAENKGKVLFVDLWATWCGPCLEGMKASKGIMPRYKNKDIEFIFLCVNSTEENWKGTLSKFKIGGKHYYCENTQSKDIRRALGVEEIPHYLIINKQGHIVHVKSMDLARSLGIIDRLLNEK